MPWLIRKLFQIYFPTYLNVYNYCVAATFSYSMHFDLLTVTTVRVCQTLLAYVLKLLTNNLAASIYSFVSL